MADVFSLSNPVFSKFAFYSAVVLGKTVVMAEVVGWSRFFRHAYICQEDVSLAKKFFSSAGSIQVKKNDQVVERFRSIHLNDLENVLPFVLTGMLYVSTKPGITEATRVFQIFAVSRLLHTVTYAGGIQPVRSLAYLAGWGSIMFMVYKVARAAC